MFKTQNGLVACTPFPTLEIKQEVNNGFATIQQKIALQELKVVFDYDKMELKTNDLVWVRGDTFKHQFAEVVFTIEGTKFILVPENLIVCTNSK